MSEIPQHLKTVKIYNWDGIFYYKNQPCEKVDRIEVGIVVDHGGDRAGSFDIHDTGYMFAKTICGNEHLRITPIDGICPTCNKPLDKHNYCSNLYHIEQNKLKSI